MIDIYLDYFKYDPFFGVSFFGLGIQFLTLIVACVALAQIYFMKKQGKYSLHLNKIDALERFAEIIKKATKFRTDFESFAHFGRPTIELDNYTLKEVTKKTDRENFQRWLDIFSKNQKLFDDATELANDLELFSMSLEDKEIFDSVHSIVAQAFCEMVESNPFVYLHHRSGGDKEVHVRYQHTIKFRNKFIKTVGSIVERKQALDKNIQEFKKEKINP